ncbi:uncharacterized protein LOC132193002 isoform X3 [Neocloeon triangulifer]|uniref:uncharacterized protein LOC132193002 isoform X3 n=1 Tax=Neocloeon triangulifer TaxID=2078957 RepID=UPI00286ECEA5|nr:uncharacterized protein LOC132193002 isoform X3 [Neocloeon triangulifer]
MCAFLAIFLLSTIWYPGEPNNLGGKENCVSIHTNHSEAKLQDSNCTDTYRYICESRDTRKTTNNMEAVLNECMAVFNVSDEEIDAALDLTSSPKLTTRVKCFLRCMGENGGFMWNGKLIDQKLLSLIETLAANEDDKQNTMLALGTCSSKQGMDECDTAAMILKCAQEQAPAFLQTVIQTVKGNSSVEYAPLPTEVHKCIANIPCIVDPQAQDDYKNNRTIPNCQIFTACGINYLQCPEENAYEYAFSKCCKYGLKMATFNTFTKVQCIVNSTMTPRGRHTWLPASRIGSTSYGWCLSKEPFNLSAQINIGYGDRMADFSINGLAISFGNDMAGTYMVPERAPGAVGKIMCEP